MSNKRQKRIAATAEEYALHISQLSVSQSVIAQTDAELYIVDRSGSQSSRKRIAKDIKSKNDNKDVLKTIISKTEKTLIKRVVAKGSKPIQIKEAQKEIADIWDMNTDESQIEVDTNILTRSRKSRSENLLSSRLRVATRGQSYNPSNSDHQDSLAEALAVEIRKRESDLKNKGEWDTSVSEFTKSVTRNDSDSDEDNEEDDNNDDDIEKSKKRKIEKLTRAQINKKKKRNLDTYNQIMIKDEKRLLKSVDSLPTFIKNLNAEEKRLEDMKILRETMKLDVSDKDAMSYDEAALVPLSDELRGSLRRITPKGCVIRDTARNMVTNGELMSKDRRKRKSYEKPHGSKNIKWFAKYKYV